MRCSLTVNCKDDVSLLKMLGLTAQPAITLDKLEN